MEYTYKYPKMDHTVDAVVFGVDFKEGCLKILLIMRGRQGEPFYGHWALPGGFVNLDEDFDIAAKRELLEETSLVAKYMEQLASFSAPDRDPRGRVVSTAYMALMDIREVKAADDAKKAVWWRADSLPPLAFDHSAIIATAMKRLRAKIRWHPIGIDFLPEQFTLSELQRLYEIVLARPIDKRNFRRKILNYGVLRETGKGKNKATLYQFDKDAYDRLTEVGVYFEV